MCSQSRSAMGYMEGVTEEYGTERRESGSMGRLAELTAGLGGRKSR